MRVDPYLQKLNDIFEKLNSLNKLHKINLTYVFFYNLQSFNKQYNFFSKNDNSIKFDLSLLSIYSFSKLDYRKQRFVFINLKKEEYINVEKYIKQIQNISNIDLNTLIDKLIVNYQFMMKLINSIYGNSILKEDDKRLKLCFHTIKLIQVSQLINFQEYLEIKRNRQLFIISNIDWFGLDDLNFFNEKFQELNNNLPQLKKELLKFRKQRKSMKKLWSIATAVRNPERLRNFLTTLKEIEGKVWNSQLQEEFQARLVKNRFYGYSNGQFYSTLSQATVQLIENLNHHISLTEAFNILREKNYPEGFAIRGRTSYKPLEKVGLAFIQNGKIKISSLGNYLLGDNYDIGKIFFRSFIKWQYPNPESRDFSDRSIYNIKPFIATLHLINEVNKICEQRNLKVKGISKQEFMIFGQSLLHYQDISSQAERLVGFRVTLDSLQSSDEKKEYIGNYITDFLSEFDNATDGNLHDYADNTIRYFRLTRYITVRGGGFYIDLEPRRMIEIQKLLDTDDASAKEFTRDDYITYMSDINQPILPWEEKNELLKIYHSTLDDIRNLEVQMSIATYTFSLENEEIEYLKSEIEKLREYRHKLQNVELKQQLQDVSQIDEVIDKLTNIRSQDLKPSIALEKYITHALNIINDAKEIKANSILSDDNDFIFTAPANKPDIECFYESFNSVCEVTMLTNRDQWHNEGQPVMRHFRDFESASSHQDNYCLFVAPAMHRDTINTFWYSVKFGYEGETDDKKQKIVPLSISQIIQILQTIKELKLQNKSFSHLKFKQFLDGIIGLKNTVTSSDEWLRAIPTILNNFKQELLCS